MSNKSTIAVVPEIGTTCLWVRPIGGSYREAQYHDIPLPAEISARLDRWAKTFLDHPEFLGDASFEAEGVAISSMIKHAIGDSFRVIYVGYTSGCGSQNYEIESDLSIKKVAD